LAALDAFPANLEDPNIKNSSGEHARFDEDLLFAPLFWLPQYLVLALGSWLFVNFFP